MTEKPVNWPFPDYGGPPLTPKGQAAPVTVPVAVATATPVTPAPAPVKPAAAPKAHKPKAAAASSAPAPTRIWPFANGSTVMATEGKGKKPQPKVDVERTADGTKHVRRANSYTSGSGEAETAFKSHAPGYGN